MGGKSWWIERGVKHRRKITGGWVSDRRVSAEERSGLEGGDKQHRCRTTGGLVSDSHVSVEERNGLEGVKNNQG